MKTLSIIACTAFIAFAGTTKAQSITQQSNSPFIFPAFTNGTVYQKGGATVEATLDYNTVTEEMMFDQNGTKMVLDQVDNIDSIIIQNVVFVPAKKVFFEKLTQTPVALYAQYRSKAVKVVKGASASNNNISNMVGVIKRNDEKPLKYDMKWPEGFQASTQTTYWVKNGNDYSAVSNEAAFAKLFPGKEAAITEYIKSNNLKWNKIEHMIKLTEFANQK